jgi:hypothetical protein
MNETDNVVSAGDGKSKKITIIPVVIALFLVVSLILAIFGIIAWQLGILRIERPGTISAYGFNKIKPQLSSAQLTPTGDFNCVFTNGVTGVGSMIWIDKNLLSIKDKDGRECGSYTITDASTSATPNSAYFISTGYNFKIKASNCPNHIAGELYTLNFKIPYNASKGGIEAEYTETGTITGFVG